MGKLPEIRYYTRFEVIEEIYEIGEGLRYDKSVTIRTNALTLRAEDLKDEEIWFFRYDEDMKC